MPVDEQGGVPRGTRPPLQKCRQNRQVQIGRSLSECAHPWIVTGDGHLLPPRPSSLVIRARGVSDLPHLWQDCDVRPRFGGPRTYGQSLVEVGLWIATGGGLTESQSQVGHHSIMRPEGWHRFLLGCPGLPGRWGSSAQTGKPPPLCQCGDRPRPVEGGPGRDDPDGRAGDRRRRVCVGPPLSARVPSTPFDLCQRAGLWAHYASSSSTAGCHIPILNP